MKSLISLLWACLFSGILHAQIHAKQSWKQLNQQVITLNQQSKYKNALPIAQQALLKAEKEFGKKRPEYARSLYDLAFIYENLGQLEKALSFYQQNLQLRGELLSQNNPEFAQGLDNIGLVYSKMGKFDKALPLYEQASSIYGQVLGKNNPTYVQSLYNVAVSYERLKQYDTALMLYQQILQITEQAAGKNHPHYATSLTSLANCYTNMGNNIGSYQKAQLLYEKALPLYQHALYLREQLAGKKHFDYEASLQSLANLYASMKQYDRALPFYQGVLLFREQVLGKKHPAYAVALSQLAGAYVQIGQYDNALPYYQQGLKVLEQLVGKKHPAYAAGLNELAGLYASKGQYDKALPFYQQASSIYQLTPGKKHPDFILSLDNLAFSYTNMDQYDKALPLFRQVLLLWEQTLAKNNLNYAHSLQHLVYMYFRKGQFKEALPLSQQALLITEKAVGIKHYNYATSLNNVAGLYKIMEQHDKALPLLQKASEIYLLTLGDNAPEYASSLENLASVYSRQGQYEKALPLNEQVLRIREKAFGKSHLNYASGLNSLAELYVNMGQYEKALLLFQQVLQIRMQILGIKHPDYAGSLQALAVVHSYIAENTSPYAKAQPIYEKADSLYQRTLQLQEQIVGKKHPDYASNLYNLASLYSHMADKIGQKDKALSLYKQAIPLHKQALQIRMQTPGIKHPDYANSLDNLAVVYFRLRQYKDALPLHQQASSIYEQMLGKNHLLYAYNLNNLALLYAEIGQPERSVSLFQEAQINVLANFRSQTPSLSERQAQDYQQTLLDNFDMYSSFALKQYNKFPTIQTWLYDQALFWKGQLLEQNTSLRRTIQQTQDSTLTALFSQWQHGRHRLAQQKLPDSELQSQVENLEQQLARRSATFRKATKDDLITFRQVRQSLKSGEAAIEFTHFRFHNGHHWTDSTFYCASVLRATDSIPTLVYLCEARQLDQLLQSTSTNAGAIQQFYSSRGIKIVNGLSEGVNAQRLYQLIWKPLESLLKEGQTIHYAPSGLLHKVAMAALPVSSNKLLMDQYQLRQVSSTRVLTEPVVASQPKPDWRAALYGGVSYQADSLELAIAVKSIAQRANPKKTKQQQSLNREYMITPLPGTAQEVDQIQTLMRAAKLKPTVYKNAAANEESFKALPQPRSQEILHLATHGYFSPDPEQQKHDPQETIDRTNRFVYSKDPLFRSGLILAGANRIWQGKPPFAGFEDGVLTAYEVAQLNLSNTKLVVLSACETALGDIKGSEGVFGLQRSFKVAGVQYLLMSLWQIPDKETAQMMKFFYSKYLSGVAIEEAFRQAQVEMRKKYEPYSWAAFVLVR